MVKKVVTIIIATTINAANPFKLTSIYNVMQVLPDAFDNVDHSVLANI